MAKAFVSKGTKIENSLKTLATIKYADKEIEVIALWDTGATNSCVSDAVVTTLGLVPTGYVPIRTRFVNRDGYYLAGRFCCQQL